MTLGKNTIEATALRGIVEEIEVIDGQMKEMRERKAAIMARAKSEGFTPAGIRYILKARAMKPHDRQEAETIRDVYMHAMGMDDEPPLFRSLAAVAEQDLARDQLMEHFKKICPPQGEIIVKVGGDPMRIWRDRQGDAHAEAHIEKKREPVDKAAPSRSQKEVPDVSETGAYEYGRQMYRDNRPITENPFPYGDPRRARCDEGWRAESGNDGMGDSED